MPLNPFRWSFRLQCFAGFVACVGLIAFAIYSQLAWGLEPCPLCIFQRLAFAALGLVFLAAAIHGPRGGAGRTTWGLLSFVAAAVGMGIAGRHVWIQLNPPPIPACGAPLSFMRESMSTPDVIRKVLTGSGDCGTVDWTLLGLSMPMWSLICFVVLGIVALVAAFNRQGALRGR